MRIAICGIRHETNTFSGLRAALSDFRVARGDEILGDGPWDVFEDVEWAPILVANAMPHGLVLQDAFESLAAEIEVGLQQVAPLDAVYLDLHGAMVVESVGDGERELVMRVRKLVGKEIPIAASLDLHGNLAPEVIEQTQILTALRTAPHIDREETRLRAVRLLVRSLREGLRPKNNLVRLPMLLPGEHAATGVEPARSLYESLDGVEKEPGILDASVMIGCAWTDSPFTSVGALIVSEDETRGREVAEELARSLWDQRAYFAPDVLTLSVEEAVREAIASEEAPVFLSDSGDNLTAGAPGDVPVVLKALLEAGAEDAVVAGIADEAAAEACFEAGEGALVDLSVGGKMDTLNGTPLEIRAEVIRVCAPDLAVAKVGGVQVVLTSMRMPFLTLKAFERARIDPTRHKIVVVKHGYLAPELKDIAGKAVMAISPGCTTLALETLPYKHIRRPMYPLDDGVEFET
jgi:microcystin degradation protein MlrC